MKESFLGPFSPVGGAPRSGEWTAGESGCRPLDLDFEPLKRTCQQYLSFHPCGALRESPLADDGADWRELRPRRGKCLAVEVSSERAWQRLVLTVFPYANAEAQQVFDQVFELEARIWREWCRRMMERAWDPTEARRSSRGLKSGVLHEAPGTGQLFAVPPTWFGLEEAIGSGRMQWDGTEGLQVPVLVRPRLPGLPLEKRPLPPRLFHLLRAELIAEATELLGSSWATEVKDGLSQEDPYWSRRLLWHRGLLIPTAWRCFHRTLRSQADGRTASDEREIPYLAPPELPSVSTGVADEGEPAGAEPAGVGGGPRAGEWLRRAKSGAGRLWRASSGSAPRLWAAARRAPAWLVATSCVVVAVAALGWGLARWFPASPDPGRPTTGVEPHPVETTAPEVAPSRALVVELSWAGEGSEVELEVVDTEGKVTMRRGSARSGNPGSMSWSSPDPPRGQYRLYCSLARPANDGRPVEVSGEVATTGGDLSIRPVSRERPALNVLVATLTVDAEGRVTVR